MRKVDSVWSVARAAMLLFVIVMSGLLGCMKQGPGTDGGETANSSDPAMLAGLELFTQHCVGCHGDDGGGGGIASIDLSPQFVPDLRHIAARSGGAFPYAHVREIIDGRSLIESHPRQMMPRWGSAFEMAEGDSPDGRERVQQQIEALVTFVESIQIAE